MCLAMVAGKKAVLMYHHKRVWVDGAATSATHIGTQISKISGAFWTGFTQPTLYALMSVLFVACLTVIAIALVVTPQTLAGDLGRYLPSASDDADGFATQEAYRTSQHAAATAQQRIYIPGNSIIAQAFASDGALRRDLNIKTNKSWDVVFLTTPLQGALDETALLDYATRLNSGVVVLSISADRLDADAAFLLRQYRYGRLGFRSDEADRQAKEILGVTPRRRTGVFLVDNRQFASLNALTMAGRWALGAPAERKIDIYLLPRTEESQRRLKAEALGAIRAMRHPASHDRIAVDVMADTVDFLKARGNRIIFFDAPIAPWVLAHAADKQAYELHLRKAERLATKLGGTYCRMRDDEHPPASVYGDPYHIKDPVWQARLRARLAECVAETHW